MLTAKFYTFSKKARSTARPVSGNTDLSVALKSPASVLAPVIEVGSISNPTVYNYCYLVDFSKYYYINDWVYDRGLWRAYLSEDLLATYKTQIGSTSLYILRSSAQYNTYLTDTLYPAECKEISKAYYPSTTTNLLTVGTTYPFEDGHFILGVVGNNTGSNSVIYYQLTSSQLKQLISYLYTTYSTNTTWGAQIVDGIKNTFFNPLENIVSLKWFPCSFPNDGASNTINIGLWTTNITAPIVTGVAWSQITFNNLPKHPQASTKGKYLNSTPFSLYQLEIYPFGVIPLDGSKMPDVSWFQVHISTDFITGQAIMNVYDRTADANSVDNVLGSSIANFGVDVPLFQNGNNLFSNILDVGKSIAVGAMTGGVVGAVIGAGAGVADNLDMNIRSKGSCSGIMAFTWPRTLYYTYKVQADEDNTNKGRPLCKMKTPSSLGGYMLADNVNLSIAATDNELNELTNLLESGFYYE